MDRAIPFNLDTVRAGQTGFIGITDSISCNATLGDTLCTTVNITTSSVECDSNNNSASDCHIVIGSCDPNGLEVQSQVGNSGYVIQENIYNTDSLTYLIHFQNIGNDTAFTVIVRDTLSNLLDVASINSIATSHSYTFRIYEQGICEWTFNNILLPDSATNELLSQGFIKFTVQQTPGNAAGTTIPNTAAIWFDYNQFLATNSTFNFIQSIVSTPTIYPSNAAASIYPNPFSVSATLAINKKLKNAELIIYNVVGEEVRRVKNIYSNVIPIERGKLCSGIYAYKIVQGNSIVINGKFSVE
ncbi:MAG: T9SS type A sorting domain-containing protein [Bacteroidetes bacterium]|nr:T9SS type A sorting domain-containing protein [Bacteroidota bacterium]